jgi:hypothetical protein
VTKNDLRPFDPFKTLTEEEVDNVIDLLEQTGLITKLEGNTYKVSPEQLAMAHGLLGEQMRNLNPMLYGKLFKDFLH